MDDQMLRVHGVSDGVFYEDLVATRLRIASIYEDIIIIFLPVLVVRPRVARIIEQAEVGAMLH